MLHSLLATKTAKGLAARALGQEAYAGVYRLAYNGVAIGTTLALAVYVRRQPDRMLYVVRGVWRVPLTSLRLLMLLCALRSAAEIGFGPFSGVSEVLAWVGRRRTFEAPEAQGPAMGRNGLKTGGPFRYVRHPLNASATAMVFLTPTMTTVRLTVAMATLLYALVGSKTEERRLLETYGEVYRRYLEGGVPFFVPRMRSIRL